MAAPGPWRAGPARPHPRRAAAATRWLARLTCPETGATPRLGHQDGSCLADLSLRGPADARGSVERAARLFLRATAGVADDPGCAWLGLPPGPPTPADTAWRCDGSRGWRDGRVRVLLRTGPLRFRPGHADLLHLDLWDGLENVLRDAGTGAYNPPAQDAWWSDHFPAARAHNVVTFDDAEPMPRASRFLFARWPATEVLPGGAATRDARGNRHARTVRREGAEWVVEDRVSGPFRHLALRWHLPPGPWEVSGGSVTDGRIRLILSADAAVSLTLEPAWESPGYGEVRGLPCLVLRAPAPVTCLTTRIRLGPATGDCAPARQGV
ncbi:heparinase II/III-family protein [Roseomonas sp. CCTCC AB2023176]|uniref:heparinase II/III family protein n=1 Tax=Roseomonas sp. CCTCC AB2023176 TaxID=3342640 RepID=UPI0035D6C922